MNKVRPNPDALLAQAQAEQADAQRGKLTVFFGYAAGVGKTYAMLQAAREAQASGREVVVGYVEPHGRPDTAALLSGLESLPLRQIEHNGVVLGEFAVDAALQRHPDILLVDELAHTNAPGSRHTKRWQDVIELLDAGMNVWTTLNVQHIESLNDIIGQITGITVRETVPDHVFDMASALEIVDITPEELLDRLRQGKVYLPAQAERALQHFFQRSNLVALRELSLRQTAKRLHRDVESERQQKAAILPWATAERLLVCVGPSPTTARVIRTAKRMAAALDSPWLAVSVEQTGYANNAVAKQQIADHMQLANRLGAETVTLTGSNVAQTILDYACVRNVTKVFIGKTQQPRWSRWWRRGVVEQLLANSGPIDVYVIQGREDSTSPPRVPQLAHPIRWQTYAAATLAVACGALLAAWFVQLDVAEANIVMMFLALVAAVAFRWGRGPAIWTSCLAVLVFDVCFVPPRWSLTVNDSQYLITFTVMLAIGVLISTLTARLQTQLDSGRQRERLTQALYRLSKQLSSLSGEVFLIAAAGQHLREMLGGEVSIYVQRPPSPEPVVAYGKETTIVADPNSVGTAHWVLTHDQIAGRGTDTLPNATALFVPLTGAQTALGALAVRVEPPEVLLQPEQRRWLENCASQLALALERDRLTLDAAEARVKAEAEYVRSTLLSGVSHDLKTPLAAIAGASSTLMHLDPTPTGTARELLETIADEADRLNRLLENVLQISRLDAGAVTPNQQWHLLEEIVGSALQRMKGISGSRHITTHLPYDLPMLYVDGLLLEQVLSNLLENALRYTSADTPIDLSAAREGETLVIRVADRGPGLPAKANDVIFDRYYRGHTGADAGRGSGLGLAICRAIMKLHHGTITAHQRDGGGAEFCLRLPVPRDSPKINLE